MNVTETQTVVQDLMDSADERELWIVGREFERPPYFHAGKGGDTRLTRALRLCTEDKITPNSDGSYQVQGSEGRSYRVADSCSCPNSQKASTKWCYHAVGVALYVEWQRRLRPVAPVALGTLRAGTLPLPPTTVEERLAHAPDLAERQYPTLDAAAHDAQARAIAMSTMPDNTALSTNHTPQEDRMADNEYIPEPDDHDAPTAILEPPAPALVAAVKIPREFTVNIKGKTHVLYTGLVIAARHDGLVSLSADWTYNDAELSLAHAVATFADGRRYEESGDASPSNVTKAISVHFRRVALTRAKARCLRDALGISECSVEELGDASVPHDVPHDVPDMTQPPSEKDLRRRIWAQVQTMDATVRTREQLEAMIKARTGMDLHPDLYEAILNRLKGQA